jgi:O-antigen/teichoic acid export membrane protein
MSGINAVSMLHDRVGLLVLALFAGDAEVGVLSVAIAGREVVLLAAQALALSAFHEVGVGQREDPSALTMRVVRHATLLAGLGNLALVPATIVLLEPVVGPGYGDVPHLIALLTPSTVALAALYQLFQYFEVRVASAAVTFKISVSALVVNAILSTALAPLWAASGVALGTSVAYVVSIAVGFHHFSRASGAPARALVPGRQELRDYVDLARSFRAGRRGGERE